jgi:hypothetical protein
MRRPLLDGFDGAIPSVGGHFFYMVSADLYWNIIYALTNNASNRFNLNSTNDWFTK